MNLEPVGELILVARKPAYSGVLVMPDRAAEQRSEVGVVMRVGQGLMDERTGVRMGSQLKKGDVVTFKDYNTVDAALGEHEISFIREGDILAVIRNGGNDASL